MGRKKALTAPEITARLIGVKGMVKGLEDAMPRAAAEMRREACEEIDDLISELRAA